MHLLANSKESGRAGMNGAFWQSFLTGCAPAIVKLTTASGSVRFQVRLIGFAPLRQPICQGFCLAAIIHPSDFVVLLCDGELVYPVPELSRKFEEREMAL